MLHGVFLIASKRKNESKGNTYYNITIAGEGISGAFEVGCDQGCYGLVVPGQYMDVGFELRSYNGRIYMDVKEVKKHAA